MQPGLRRRFLLPEALEQRRDLLSDEMPRRLIKAITGGAGERTFIML